MLSLARRRALEVAVGNPELHRADADAEELGELLKGQDWWECELHRLALE